MTARIDALQAQIAALKKELTEARRSAPAQAVRDYTFTRPDGSPVTLRELFGPHRDLLVVHNMGRRCVYCTLWADGFNGLSPHLLSRAGFALSSPDEPAILDSFAQSRGWKFPCVSTQGSTFAADMGMEPEPGRHWPGVSAFSMADDATIVRTGSAPFGPGDDFCALWPMLDLLKDGPGGWAPKFEYPES